ncbi:MAG TPA: hypothetical protein PLS25_07375 [Methanoregulaceae archaeon]|nr:hypothetical protein [Methanoregulaceae archaeon]
MLSSFHSIQPLHVHGVTAGDVASVEGREDITGKRGTEKQDQDHQCITRMKEQWYK